MILHIEVARDNKTNLWRAEAPGFNNAFGLNPDADIAVKAAKVAALTVVAEELANGRLDFVILTFLVHVVQPAPVPVSPEMSAALAAASKPAQPSTDVKS